MAGLALALIAAPGARAAPALAGSDRPSFSCSPAASSAVEGAICADPSLAQRDQTLALLYAAARTNALGSGPSQQQALQHQWLRSRDARCAKTAAHACVADAYDERPYDLAVAALFAAPDVALAELARQDAHAAPLYEAVYRYATIDDQAKRTGAVEALIAPAFDAIHGEFAAQELFADIPTARAAAASDKAFATLLDAASVSGYTLTLPCAALIKRPGLIDALDPRYGGAVDGQLANSDCDAMMPDLPHLARLTKTAIDAQPVCEGTIRFTLGRAYAKTLVAIRLHRSDLWKPGDPHAPPPGSDGAEDGRFRTAHRAWIDAAVAELARYYSDVFKVPPYAAKADAGGAVNAVISGAFALCD
jgi:uncharacterized protein